MAAVQKVVSSTLKALGPLTKTATGSFMPILHELNVDLQINSNKPGYKVLIDTIEYGQALDPQQVGSRPFDLRHQVKYTIHVHRKSA